MDLLTEQRIVDIEQIARTYRINEYSKKIVKKEKDH